MIEVEGLGLFDVEIVFFFYKVLWLLCGEGFGVFVLGYEIYYGWIICGDIVEEFFGGVCDGLVFGIMWYGLLEGDVLCEVFL